MTEHSTTTVIVDLQCFEKVLSKVTQLHINIYVCVSLCVCVCVLALEGFQKRRAGLFTIRTDAQIWKGRETEILYDTVLELEASM